MPSVQVAELSERSIGRSGRNLFLSQKDITIIMVPYERHSIFPQAVDDLYRKIEVPFNLIVIEGNAPEDVRIALEKRQRQQGNMTIIYTNHCPGLPSAYNLALSHLRTPYALFMDNEIRLPKGTLENMLEAAHQTGAAVIYPKGGMVPRNIISRRADGQSHEQAVESFGLRPCFLMAHEPITSLGKVFDEFSTPYTMGLDLVFKLRSRGFKLYEHQNAVVETRLEGTPKLKDSPLFRNQWNAERIRQSHEQLEKKWSVRFAEDSVYENWIQNKIEQAEKPVGWKAACARLLTKAREVSWVPVRETGLIKNA